MAEQTVLKFRGKVPTPKTLVELWTNAEKRFEGTNGRTDRILKCQGLRRFTDRVALDADFVRLHPEVNAESAISMLPEREKYERDLITKAGSVEPKISRQPLDVTDTAVDQAEEYESYMREVAQDEAEGVPFQAFIEKLTEDGEVGVVKLPADLDADGIPDFYDRLTERALARLKGDEKKAYTRDEHDRRGRHVRRDADGNREFNPKYDRDQKGRTRDDAERKDGPGSFKRDHDKSTAAHEAAVRRYLLQNQATTTRVIPALDCFPLLGRGSGRQRWTVEGLIERSLMTREEIVERKFGWDMLGSRLLLPKGASWTHAGKNGDFYLYTAYLTLHDEDGVGHPTILYTVGGASTYWDGTKTGDGGEDGEVAIIDLYEERKIARACWTYEFGNHTGDDDPNWYGRPAVWPFRNRILNIEALETAAQVTVQLEAYTGSIYKPDAKLAELDPEATLDTQTHTLRRPVKPKPGDVEPWLGDIVPFQQNRIGDDAWRLTANYQLSLAQGMAIDQVQDGQSGAAMLVESSQGQVAKRHIRDAAIRLYKFCLEADALIRMGAYKCHKIKWPILTTEELPVGHERRSRATVTEFNPDWLGEDENPRLQVTYGEEFNLARAQMEMDAADRGYRALEHVAAAFGETDTMALRVAVEKDKMWKAPEGQLLLTSIVDRMRGMTKMRQAALMQAQARMTKGGPPGADEGLPTAMLRRVGEQAAGVAAGGGGPRTPSIAGSVKGGVIAGAKRGDAMALQAEQGAA